MPELKPCPKIKCEGHPRVSSEDGFSYYAWCDACLMRGPLCACKEEAALAWNYSLPREQEKPE